MWANTTYKFKNGQYIYFKYAGNSDWTSATYVPKFNWFWDSGSWCSADLGTAVPGTSNAYYYATVPNEYTGYIQILRMNGSNTDEQWNYTSNFEAVSDHTKNCFYLSGSGWDNVTLTATTYAPPAKSVALSYDVVPSSGSGTSLDPYIVPTGTTVRVTAAGTSELDDPDITKKYKWDSGSYGTTAYKDLSCSTNNTTYSTTVSYKNYISSTASTNDKSATVYFKAVSTPTISLSAPSTGVRGNSITLTATPANASTPTIVYEYSTSSTFASSITSIASTTSTTQSWTIPAGTSGTTYYLRARMTISATTYYSSILTLTAYGKKTIHVKNSNNWSTLYLYAWDSSSNLLNGDWPGTSGAGSNGLSCTNTGGQWWDVVITTQVDGFILNQNVSGDANQTADLSYTTYTDDRCLAIGTNEGKRTLSNSVVTCPSAPTSISTSAATSLTNTTATINGSIGGNGNDNITSYGFYWGTSATPGTQVEKGTSNYTGSISHNLTSLTAGTTYYYQAYATNGQGTTKSTPVASFKAPYSVTVQKPTGCSSITPDAGSYYYSTGFTVTTVAATGYSFSSWSATNGTTSSASSPSTGTNTVTFTPTANSAVIKPVYTENKSDITISAGAGGRITTPASLSNPYSLGVATKKAIVATPNPGYYFKNWTCTGTAVVENANSASTNAKTDGTSGGMGTVTANFEKKWAVYGSTSDLGSWSTPQYLDSINATKWEVEVTLSANTSYTFKLKYLPEGESGWYGYGTEGESTYHTFVGQTGTVTLAKSTANLRLLSAGAGKYKFTINPSTKALSVTYPTVTHPTNDYVYFKNTPNWSPFKAHIWGGTSGTSTGWSNLPTLSTCTFDSKTYYYAAIGDHSTFMIVNSDNDNNKTADLTASTHMGKYYDVVNKSTQSSEVAARWYDFKITITLNQQSATSNSSPTSYNPIYNSTVLASLSGNPSKTGYTYEGFYTAIAGGGSQLIGTDKAWKQVANYTDASKHWIKTASATLYAKWTQSVTLNQNSATTNGSTSVSATFNGSIGSITAPSKDGYTFGGWCSGDAGSILVINASGVLQQNVTDWTSNDATPKWKHEGASTLYAKWTQTVTLNANTSYHGSGDNTSATILLNATSKSSITHCTPATGYHLVGYYTAATAGTKILDADGSFAGDNITVSDVAYTSSGKWVKAGATTLYAQYAPNTYTINFNKNDGSYVGTATGTTASVNATYDANVTLTANGFSLTGYTFAGWATTSGGSVEYLNGATLTTPNFTSTDGGTYTLYAKWTENTYSTTVSNDGHGTVSPTGSVNISHHTGTTLTATPSTNYVFKDWTISGGGITPTTSSSKSQVFKATSAGGSIRANFADEWNIMGNQWGSWGTYNGMPATGNANEFSVTLTLAARTNYEFKVVKRVYNGDDVYYTNASTTFTRGGTTTVTGLTTGGTGNHMTLTTDAAGDYTFTFKKDASTSNMKVTITFPTAYTVTFGKGTGGATITATASASGTLTSGNYVAAGENITFTQTASTGYTFSNWYDAITGGSVVSTMGASDNILNGIAANATVYSRYTANTYAVTFDYATNGGTKTSGNDVNNATYDQATMPVPTVKKDGYCIGWYSASEDGTLVIDASGNLQPNVEVDEVIWTDEDGKWKKTSAATVYAQFAIPTISMNPNPSLLNAGGKKDTIVLHPTYSCPPTGDYNITYAVGYQANHTLMSPQPPIIYGTGAGVGYDSIKMPLEANIYELIAILKTGSTRGEGTEIRRDTMRYAVQDKYTITLRYMVDGVDVASSTTWYAFPRGGDSARVKAPLEKEGYVLDYWELGVGIDTCNNRCTRDAYTEDRWVYAENNGTIKLHYKTRPNTVYFFDTFGRYWYSTMMKKYDYGTSGYWNTGKGAGAKGYTSDTVKASTVGLEHDRMYAAIEEGTTHLAFTHRKMDGSQNFWGHKDSYEHETKAPLVIYRTDFNAATPMFVPVTTDIASDYYVLNHTDKDGDTPEGEAHYYRGFWIKNSPVADSTGYYLKVYNQVEVDGGKLIQSIPLRLTQTGEGGSFELTATMDLEGGKTYGFKFTKADTGGTKWFGNASTMTSANHTGWVFATGTNNCGLTTTAAGDYTFHVYCKDFGTIAANTATAAQVQGQLAVTVDYSTLANDYRLLYSDAVQTEPIASYTVQRRAEGKDTVSFFIRPNNTPSLKIQKFTGSAWEDSVAVSLEGIAKDSVYVFYLEQSAETGKLIVTGHDYYDGDFYIRTDCVDEHKWDYKQSLAAHRMTPSDYGQTSIQPFKFSHYYAHWCEAKTNVKYVIANKYAPCITDTVITDAYADSTGGFIKAATKGASVRFMYNKGTNATQRAYLAGAQGSSYDPDYLKITTSGDKMGTTAATPSTLTELTFNDEKNWIYQAAIKAKPGLTAKLTAEFNGNTQYFLGSSSEEEQILGGTGDAWQQILLTYDFKQNRLICAWQPSGDSINGNVPINADVMIIREAQDDAQQIIFKNNDSKLSSVKYIYSVMQFNYDDMVGHMWRWDYTTYSLCMYYISFPYDVAVNDIMAPGSIGQEWRLQRYNGEKRAKGWFAGDGVTTFWEDLQAGDTLKAYEGYSLLLNRRIFNDGSSSVWENKKAGDKLYMYFPSINATTGVVANETVNVVVPQHLCEVDRVFDQDLTLPSYEQRNHKVVDSHWNMIGTPLFEDKVAAVVTEGPRIDNSVPLAYIYEWNPAGNVLTVAAALNTSFEFKTMYSYMAQYAGTITFIGSAVHQNSVAARRAPETRHLTMELELSKENEFVGRTYIELRENAADTFQLNEDMCMLKNGVTADIYTKVGGYEAAANVLSIGNHTIPVELEVKTAGTYTFSMPKDFSGMVTLLDTYTQTRTNLSLDVYEVYLEQGTIADRFFIELDIQQNTTSLENVDGNNGINDGGVHKFIQNDKMFILKNGVIYDARGARVK